MHWSNLNEEEFGILSFIMFLLTERIQETLGVYNPTTVPFYLSFLDTFQVSEHSTEGIATESLREVLYWLCGNVLIWDGGTHFSVSWNTRFSFSSFWVGFATEGPRCSAPCWWMAAESLHHVSDGQSGFLCWHWASGDAEPARSF